MKRPLGAALLLFLIGIVYAVYGVWEILIVGIVLLLIFSGFTVKSRIRAYRKMLEVVLFFALFFIGIIRGNIYTSDVADRVAGYSDGDKVSVTCIVDNIENRSDSIRISGKSAYFSNNGKKIGKIYIYPPKYFLTDKGKGTSYQAEGQEKKPETKSGSRSGDSEWPIDIYPGDRIDVTGEISLLKPASNEGGYDEERQLWSQGIFFKIYNSTIQEERRPFFSISRYLYRFRCHLRDVYLSYLPGEEGNILSGMTIGDKSDIPDNLMDIFKLAGICHLLSVSGTHIDVVSRGLYRRLKKQGFGVNKSSFAGLIAALLYGKLCGNSVSTVRSVGMFFVSIVAKVTGASYDGVTSLMAVGSIMLFLNPVIIEYSGFVFSFGTVLGVMIFAVPIHDRYKDYKRKKWDEARECGMKETKEYHPTALDIVLGQLIFSMAIQLFTIPIISFFYYEIPVYGAFLNLFLLPLFPYLLVSGLIGGILGTIGLHSIGNIFLYLCHIILYFFEAASDYSINLPASTLIVGKPKWWWIVIYYMVLYILFKAIKQEWHFIVSVICMSIILGIIVLPRSNLKEIDMLDLGQGDGIYFSEGDGTNIFIDGGSSSIDKVGKYNILPFLKYRCVRKIDVWFVSHSDTDHISGLAEALDSGYPIGKIITSEQILNTGSFQEIKEKALSRHIEVSGVTSGDKIVFSGKDNIEIKKKEYSNKIKSKDTVSMRKKHSEIQVLSPYEGERNEDINCLSLVFILRSGDFSGLFTGDIDSKTEHGIIDRCGIDQLSDITILKASHHGSKYSNSMNFIDTIRPKVTIISAGRKNSYGHPGKDTINRLKDIKSQVYCTKWQYQVKIKLKNNGKYVIDTPCVRN